MKNNNIKIILMVLVLAFMMLAGIVVLFVAWNKLSASQGTTQAKTETVSQEKVQKVASATIEEPVENIVDVLIPVRDIKFGEKFTRSMFKVERRPQSLVQGNVISNFAQIDGAYAKTNLLAKNPISIDDISVKKSVNTITANIPEGYRAVTINVNVTSSVEGWARAGAFVDIVWNATIGGRPSTIVIIQNVKILSAERQIEGNPENGQAPVPSTVTLLVLAEDATKIHLAETTGRLTLQLRGDSQDRSIQKNSMITIDDLLDKKRGKEKGKYSAIVKIKGRNGKMESWGLTDDGNLEPVK